MTFGRGRRAPVRATARRRARADDARDAVVLDNDVHGPNGGAPVPSITMTLRIVSVGNGPAPSPGRRSGAGMRVPCRASTDQAGNHERHEQ